MNHISVLFYNKVFFSVAHKASIESPMSSTFLRVQQLCPMITSSTGNIFRVTGPLWGNSPVTGEFPAQRPVTRSFDVFFNLRLHKRWGLWLRRHRAHYDVTIMPSSGFCVLCVISYHLRCDGTRLYFRVAWWRHEIETLLALLAICEENLSVNSGFPSQKARNTDVSLFIGYGIRGKAPSLFQSYLGNKK